MDVGMSLISIFANNSIVCEQAKMVEIFMLIIVLSNFSIYHLGGCSWSEVCVRQQWATLPSNHIRYLNQQRSILLTCVRLQNLPWYKTCLVSRQVLHLLSKLQNWIFSKTGPYKTCLVSNTKDWLCVYKYIYIYVFLIYVFSLYKYVYIYIRIYIKYIYIKYT